MMKVILWVCAAFMLVGCGQFKKDGESSSPTIKMVVDPAPTECTPTEKILEKEKIIDKTPHQPQVGICILDHTGGNTAQKGANADLSNIETLTEFRVYLPAHKTDQSSLETLDQTARVDFYRGSTKVDAIAIDQALDFYDRAGYIGQVSGGVFGGAPNYETHISFKLSVNVKDHTKGFVELSIEDETSGNPNEEAYVNGLTCAWSELEEEVDSDEFFKNPEPNPL